MKERCRVPGCNQAIPTHLIMCLKHWNLLPRRLMDRIYNRQSSGYAVAVKEAITYVQSIEVKLAKAHHTGLPPTVCPVCDYTLDACSGMNAESQQDGPEPGDVTVCMRCGSVLQYTDGMSVIRITPEKKAQIDADPEWRSVLDTAIAGVQSIRPLMDQKYGPLKTKS